MRAIMKALIVEKENLKHNLKIITDLINKDNEINLLNTAMENLKSEHEQTVKSLELEHKQVIEKTTKEFEKKINEIDEKHTKELALIQNQNKTINEELMNLKETINKDYVPAIEYTNAKKEMEAASKNYKELVDKYNSLLGALREKEIIDKDGNFTIKE